MPFVPVIDNDLLRWWGQDQLWQSEDARYSADSVRVIPGPISVAGITTVDEPVADILGRFEAAAMASACPPNCRPVPPTDAFSRSSAAAEQRRGRSSATARTSPGSATSPTNPAYGTARSATPTTRSSTAALDGSGEEVRPRHPSRHLLGQRSGRWRLQARRARHRHPADAATAPKPACCRSSTASAWSATSTRCSPPPQASATPPSPATSSPTCRRSPRPTTRPPTRSAPRTAAYTLSANLGYDHEAATGGALPQDLAPSPHRPRRAGRPGMAGDLRGARLRVRQGLPGHRGPAQRRASRPPHRA